MTRIHRTIRLHIQANIYKLPIAVLTANVTDASQSRPTLAVTVTVSLFCLARSAHSTKVKMTGRQITAGSNFGNCITGRLYLDQIAA
jgi:hypothetical protein